MARKSFNEKLHDSKDTPKVIKIEDEKSIKRYGGENMLLAPPIEYHKSCLKFRRKSNYNGWNKRILG